MKKLKRVSIFLVAFIMLFSSVPFGSFAAEENNITLTVEQECTQKLYAEPCFFSVDSQTEFYGCYGNQLTGLAVEFYDSFVQNFVTDGITNEFTHTLKTPFIFDAKVENGSIQLEGELEEIYYELSFAFQVAKAAFTYDYPEIFWLGNLKISYSISASGNYFGYVGKIEAVDFTPSEFYRGAASDVNDYNRAVTASVEKIAASLENPDDEIATVKAIHDYVCKAAYYAYNGDACAHSCAPVFIGDGGVVCEGYAKAFKVLCSRFDIPCVLVSGDAGGNHMWNYVQLSDGKWYLVDATWDDQDSRIYYTYLLANSNSDGFYKKIRDERSEDPYFSGTESFAFAYPVLSSEAYSVHVHEWESDYTVDLAPTCRENGSKSIHCKTCDAVKDTVTVSATNHPDRYHVNGEDATCTQKGYTSGVYCPDCESWISGHAEIPLKSHLFNEKIIDEAHLVSPATTQSPAVYRYDCADCDTICNSLTFTHGDKQASVGKTEKITAIQNTSAIKLTWTPVEGAAGYRVYQLINSRWKALGNVTSSSAIIKNLAAGTVYSFAIKAAAIVEGKVIWADDYAVINTATQALKPAKIVSAQNTSAIRLTWTPCEGATGYRIFYKSAGGWKVCVSTTSATSHTFKGLKAGARYTFAVRPYIITESGIIWSAYTTFTASTTPAAPTAKVASPSKGKISLTWNSVAGADGYQVYYKAGNGSFKLYKTYSGVQKLSFSSLKSGTGYTFAVRAFAKTSGGNVYSSYKPVALTVK